MDLLPESTNARYHGSIWSAAYLGLTGVMSVGPGCIHYFLPDGGAGVIAGLDLSANRATIIGIFAWEGASQIALGIAQLLVATRYRALVPLFLLLQLIETALDAVAFWITKVSPTGHHPPENYAALVTLPLLVIFLALSLRRRRDRLGAREAVGA
jgi:hypothetical protein